VALGLFKENVPLVPPPQTFTLSYLLPTKPSLFTPPNLLIYDPLLSQQLFQSIKISRPKDPKEFLKRARILSRSRNLELEETRCQRSLENIWMHAPFDKASLCSIERDLLGCNAMLCSLDSREPQRIDHSRVLHKPACPVMHYREVESRGSSWVPRWRARKKSSAIMWRSFVRHPSCVFPTCQCLLLKRPQVGGALQVSLPGSAPQWIISSLVRRYSK